MKPSDDKAPARRDFLKLASMGAGALAVSSLTGGSVQAAAPDKKDDASGYRESEHVKRYYETARF